LRFCVSLVIYNYVAGLNCSHLHVISAWLYSTFSMPPKRRFKNFSIKEKHMALSSRSYKGLILKTLLSLQATNPHFIFMSSLAWSLNTFILFFNSNKWSSGNEEYALCYVKGNLLNFGAGGNSPKSFSSFFQLDYYIFFRCPAAIWKYQRVCNTFFSPSLISFVYICTL
jgi:hypothetical protein